MIHAPMPPNFDELYIKKLQDEIDSTTGHLLGGRFTDFSEYKAATARITALENAKTIFQALVSKLQGE